MRELLAARRLRNESGFSLVELMLVVGITGVLSGMAVFQIGVSQTSSKGDGAMRVVLAQLNTARELAITQRRIMLVNFLDPGVGGCPSGAACVQIVRQEIAGTTTVLSTVPFEGAVRYNMIAAAQCSLCVDTPDMFGNANAKDFGGVTTGYGFTSDGSFLNGATGTPINGTLFLSVPNSVMSYRSVTILGSTGRVRAFRWNGRAWKLV